MKKVLFLPLLQMQSGHHQVAEALMDLLKRHTKNVSLKKVDLLSYSNVTLEKMITKSYLKWINYAPETYNLIYKKFFNSPIKSEHSFRWYQHFFLKKMEKLINEEKPDLIICTHGFPSRLVSQLKAKGQCNVPIINVYTDFFVNSIWDTEGVDFHFVPSKAVKERLIAENKISKKSMIVTGIPVHEDITLNSHKRDQNIRLKVLISGGSSGLGGILNLMEDVKGKSQIDFLVLCGNNQNLYHEILSWGMDHIKPLPYLSSRSEMNRLYEEVNAIITKPGGVTISEALKKKLPIFIHSALPGQEEINLKYLKEQGLVFELNHETSLEDQLISKLSDPVISDTWSNSITAYHKEIEAEGSGKMVEMIEWFLKYNEGRLNHRFA